MLDIIEYYLDSKGHDVARIDGSVKLEERRKQVMWQSMTVCYYYFTLQHLCGRKSNSPWQLSYVFLAFSIVHVTSMIVCMNGNLAHDNM